MALPVELPAFRLAQIVTRHPVHAPRASPSPPHVRNTSLPPSSAKETASPPSLNARLARLEGTITLTQKKARRWRKAFWVALVVAAVSAGTVGAAINSTTSNWAGIFGEVNKYSENSFLVTGTATDVTPVALSVQGGTSGAAVEMVGALGAANTALNEGNWFYKATVQEATAAALASGTFKIELFVDSVSKGAVYLKQDTPDAAAVEGVTIKWDLGSTLNGSSAYVVKITQV